MRTARGARPPCCRYATTAGRSNLRVVFVRTRDAGGQQFIGGIFLQDVYTPIPALEIGGRGDYWYSYGGTRHDTPPAAGVLAEQTFNDIERIIPSGRLAALFHATPTTALRASVYQNFRVPTLNEQYRVLRVRSDVTMANGRSVPSSSRAVSSACSNAGDRSRAG